MKKYAGFGSQRLVVTSNNRAGQFSVTTNLEQRHFLSGTCGSVPVYDPVCAVGATPGDPLGLRGAAKEGAMAHSTDAYLGRARVFCRFSSPLASIAGSLSALPFFIVAAQMFVVGFYDDLRRINPATKLIGQIISAATAIFFGYSLGFFTWQPLDALLTALWIVGLTNALNLLDNMDGLAGGIALIAALYLAFLFNQHGDTQHTVVALALAGAAAGFLFIIFIRLQSLWGMPAVFFSARPSPFSPFTPTVRLPTYCH